MFQCSLPAAGLIEVPRGIVVLTCAPTYVYFLNEAWEPPGGLM